MSEAFDRATEIENEVHPLRSEVTAVHHALFGLLHERLNGDEQTRAAIVDLATLLERSERRANRILAIAYGKEPEPLENGG